MVTLVLVFVCGEETAKVHLLLYEYSLDPAQYTEQLGALQLELLSLRIW